MGSEKGYFWKNAHGVDVSDNIEKLNEIYNTIQRINSKVILFSLIEQAKSEYDKCDYETGRKSLIQAYFEDKKNPIIYRGLGCISQHNGKLNFAVRMFKLALKYSKKREVEYALIGMIYYLQDKLEEAVKYFNLALDENDEFERAYEGRNQSMLEMHLKISDLQDALRKYF